MPPTDKYAALFAREAREQVRAARLALPAVGGADAEATAALDALFRAVHTIKGMAGAMGHAAAERIAHTFEEALGLLREAPARRRDVPALLATTVDALDDAVEASITPSPSVTIDQRAGDALLAALCRDPGSPNADPSSGGGPDDDDAPAPGAPGGVAEPERALRVDVGVLDRLLDWSGELRTAHARLADAAAHVGHAPLARAVAELGRVAGGVSREVRAARLVTLADLYAELPRVVRQAARDTGKRVRLDLHGAEVVADRGVVDALAEPLVHLLRNAVDHGVEHPGVRAAAGKTEEGRVAVRARREAGALVVTVADDGRGVDRAAVLARARTRGHDVPDGTADDAALLACLALPGLTTAPGVGRVSGRGVGVDAALARVRALGGSLALRTAPGAGTTFTLRLPLSWAVVPALVVRAGDDAYALPLAHVRAARDATPDDDAAPTLAALLGSSDAFTAAAASEVVMLAPAGDAGGLAVRVDAVVGVRECVLKPLHGPPGAFDVAVGATILDGGEVALVLDVPAVVGRPAAGRPAALTTAT